MWKIEIFLKYLLFSDIYFYLGTSNILSKYYSFKYDKKICNILYPVIGIIGSSIFYIFFKNIIINCIFSIILNIFLVHIFFYGEKKSLTYFILNITYSYITIKSIIYILITKFYIINICNIYSSLIASILSLFILNIFEKFKFYEKFKKYYLLNSNKFLNLANLYLILKNIIILIILLNFEYNYGIFSDKVIILILLWGLIIYRYLFIYLLDKVSGYNIEKYNNKIISKYLKKQLDHYNSLERYIYNTRILLHDYRHHLIVINTLIANNNTLEVKKYMKELTENIAYLENQRICENNIIEAIIQSKIFECENYGIEFIYDIKLPKVLPIENIHIVIILGNLLENAIEACNNITSKDIKKYIKISGKIINNNIVVKIINSRDNIIKKTKGFFYTSKANKENHGFGISSVKNIISKYNGNIFFYINKNEFEVNFRIKIKE